MKVYIRRNNEQGKRFRHKVDSIYRYGKGSKWIVKVIRFYQVMAVVTQ